MSELSELIKINKNIEKQNEEIIRLLKKIAGEEESPEDDLIKIDFTSKASYESAKESLKDDLIKINFSKKNPFEDVAEEDPVVEVPEDDGETKLLQEVSHDVYFIEGTDLFGLTIENNETTVDNLTGDSESFNFNLAEMVANESINKNQSLDDYTVILNEEETQELPESLRICYESGAKKVFIPWSKRSQLLFAPPMLMEVMKIDFYKSDEELVEKLFSE